MRILIINCRTERQYISALIESLFERKVAVNLSGDYMSFEVDSYSVFFSAVWHVYAEFSKDSRGFMIRQRRFFRVDDRPITFWYEFDLDNKGLMVGWV
jgi:hypothetical protein